MGWWYLVLSVLGLVHAVNALAPRKDNLPVLIWSFFAAWLTIELVWHNVVVVLLVTALFAHWGAFHTVPGLVGLGLMAVVEVLLVSIGWTTRRTVVLVRDALADLEPGPDAPRFPRSHVLFPFLIGRRRGVKLRRNIPFARVGGKTLRLDVTVPSAPVPGGGTRRPALLQVHGGGWVIGDKREQGLPLLTHMATQGWVGFNANYRLSPGVKLHDQVVDVKRSLVWIREHADEYGIDPDFICITGGSAGGHLCALMAVTEDDPRYQPGFEGASTALAAAVPFYGIYDFRPGSTFTEDRRVYRMFLEPFVFKAFVADEPEPFAEASPITHVHPGVPAFFVIHGDKDTLAPVEDARAFVAALREVSTEPVAYAEMRGAQHAFDVFPSLRSARVVEGVERFLSTLWERRQQGTSKVEGELADALTD